MSFFFYKFNNFSQTGLLRAAFNSSDLPLLRAFAPAGAALFDEYTEWRAGSQRDVDYGAGEPFEPIVRLLLDTGIDKETLLGQV